MKEKLKILFIIFDLINQPVFASFQLVSWIYVFSCLASHYYDEATWIDWFSAVFFSFGEFVVILSGVELNPSIWKFFATFFIELATLLAILIANVITSIIIFLAIPIVNVIAKIILAITSIIIFLSLKLIEWIKFLIRRIELTRVADGQWRGIGLNDIENAQPLSSSVVTENPQREEIHEVYIEVPVIVKSH